MALYPPSFQRYIGYRALISFYRKERTLPGDLMYIPALMLHGSEVTGNETLQLISIFTPPFDGKDRIYV